MCADLDPWRRPLGVGTDPAHEAPAALPTPQRAHTQLLRGGADPTECTAIMSPGRLLCMSTGGATGRSLATPSLAGAPSRPTRPLVARRPCGRPCEEAGVAAYGRAATSAARPCCPPPSGAPPALTHTTWVAQSALSARSRASRAAHWRCVAWPRRQSAPSSDKSEGRAAPLGRSSPPHTESPNIARLARMPLGQELAWLVVAQGSVPARAVATALTRVVLGRRPPRTHTR